MNTLSKMSTPIPPALADALQQTVDIALQNDVSHRALTDHLRNLLFEKSNNLPRIPILYSDTYGGYGYSKAFTAFCQDQPRNRYKAYTAVVGFGKFICQELPHLSTSNDEPCQLQKLYSKDVHGAVQRCHPQSEDYVSVLTQRQHERIGLIFASGRYADLKVAWVPPLLHCRVQEYDGKETLVY